MGAVLDMGVLIGPPSTWSGWCARWTSVDALGFRDLRVTGDTNV
jgi:hypothetical protein